MKKLFPLVLIACLACSESNEPSPSQQPTDGLDQFGKALAQIERTTNELEFIGRSARIGIPEAFAACASVSTTMEDGYTVYRLDFSETECADGKVRDGDLQIAVNPETHDVIIQSIGFFVDDLKIEGIYTLQPIVEEGVGYTKFLSTAAKITNTKNGDWISFTTSKYFRWKEGEETATINDDVIEITSGEYFLSVRNSGLCMLEIETPLELRYACNTRNWLPVSGDVRTETVREITRVDFGNGECSATPTQQKTVSVQ